MAFIFPDTWKVLTQPHKRAELLDSIDELVKPERTAVWITPASANLIVGIDQVFHFFFDDNDFDQSAIGACLFDGGELKAILEVMSELNAIHRTNRRGDDEYFLRHPGWSQVVSAADAAYILLASRGLAEWQEGLL